MANLNECFIAVYTHECKQYCDVEFFDNLFKSHIGDAQISIIDNTLTLNYYDRLQNIVNLYDNKNISVSHVDVSRDDARDARHQFLINVTTSLTELRRQFLETDKKYFIIVESDVKPRDKNWLTYFMEVVDQADIIGGLYYVGFHKQELWDTESLVYLPGILSGCTLYKREVIEKFPFRWSIENHGAFCDAWICYDCNIDNMGTGQWRLGNYTKIKCDHLHINGNRGLDKIN